MFCSPWKCAIFLHSYPTSIHNGMLSAGKLWLWCVPGGPWWFCLQPSWHIDNCSTYGEDRTYCWYPLTNQQWLSILAHAYQHCYVWCPGSDLAFWLWLSVVDCDIKANSSLGYRLHWCHIPWMCSNIHCRYTVHAQGSYAGSPPKDLW